MARRKKENIEQAFVQLFEFDPEELLFQWTLRDHATSLWRILRKVVSRGISDGEVHKKLISIRDSMQLSVSHALSGQSTTIFRSEADRIAHLIRIERHNHNDVAVREMRCGMGYTRKADTRQIDLWVMKVDAKADFPAYAYEIKTSRADFRKDLRDPEKQRGARVFSNYFFYVAPVGIIPPEEVPEWAGLLEVYSPDPENPTAKLIRVKKKAFHTSKNAPSWGFVGSLLRRVEIPEENVEEDDAVEGP